MINILSNLFANYLCADVSYIVEMKIETDWNSNRVATVSRHEGIGLAAMSQEGFRAAFQRA